MILSALATTPDEADSLLEVLVREMEERFDILSAHGVSDLWDLPAKVRPVPLIVLVDEVAELFLTAVKKDEERRDRMVMRLVRLAQMARAICIYLEVCGQRFGSDLGKGATMLRAQLTGRVVHRVNGKQTAEMGLADIAPDAVFAATTIAPDRPGVAVAGDSSGGWSRIRTPEMTATKAVAICREYAHMTPDIAALAPFRPVVRTTPAPAAPLAKPGGGYPDQAPVLVGQGEKVQVMAAVLARIVPPVGLAGAAPGADEGAVGQDQLPALLGDLLQGAVQAWGLGGEQSDQLVAPAADGGLGHIVSAGHVGQALVVAQYGQDDHRDLPGRQDPPPGPDRLQMAP